MHQFADLFERAEDDGDFARPGLAVGQQPLDPGGDHFDFAELPGGGEDFDAEDGEGRADSGFGIRVCGFGFDPAPVA